MHEPGFPFWPRNAASISLIASIATSFCGASQRIVLAGPSQSYAPSSSSRTTPHVIDDPASSTEVIAGSTTGPRADPAMPGGWRFRVVAGYFERGRTPKSVPCSK